MECRGELLPGEKALRLNGAGGCSCQTIPIASAGTPEFSYASKEEWPLISSRNRNGRCNQITG
jgi:hypothetical protein